MRPAIDAAMKYIHENGGIIIYLRQEGRNIGIINKLRLTLYRKKDLIPYRPI
jgi:GTP cyclohydrolase II